MALIACKECGQQVSNAAEACPHCGAPPRLTAAKAGRGVWTAVKLAIGLVVLLLVYKCSQVLVAVGEVDQAVAGLAFTPAAASKRCSPSAFAVSGVRIRREHDHLIVTASLKNNGAADCGAQLKLTVFDKANNALYAEDIWPASTRNIPSGATEHFTYYVTDQADASSIEFVPIAAREWRQ